MGAVLTHASCRLNFALYGVSALLVYLRPVRQNKLSTYEAWATNCLPIRNTFQGVSIRFRVAFMLECVWCGGQHAKGRAFVVTSINALAPLIGPIDPSRFCATKVQNCVCGARLALAAALVLTTKLLARIDCHLPTSVWVGYEEQKDDASVKSRVSGVHKQDKKQATKLFFVLGFLSNKVLWRQYIIYKQI
jgi:hypothetical protein